jgi:hypothetical protein
LAATDRRQPNSSPSEAGIAAAPSFAVVQDKLSVRDPVTWMAAAIVILALAAVLAPTLRTDRLLAFRDAASYYAPLFEWCRSEWGAGRVPLWNPLENCGTPVHADPTTSLGYPGKLIFALPLPFAWQYKLYVAGHLVLCAATSAWLARCWQASPAAAALAALCYSLGGSILSQHANIVYLVGAAWLPLAAGQLDSVVRQPNIRSAVLLSVILALVVLGGDPQLAYHVILMGTICLAVVGFARYTAKPAEPIPPASHTSQVSHAGWRRLLAPVGCLAVSAIFAALLAAVQILPAAEAAAASERARYVHPRSLYESLATLVGDRGKDAPSGPHAPANDSLPPPSIAKGLGGPPAAGTHHAAVYEFSVAPWRFAELVWPNCGGQMFPTHRRWFSLLPEESRIWSPSLYLGLVPLALGIGAMGFRRADVRTIWLTWLVVLFALGSLGTFGLGWLARHAASLFGQSGHDFPVGDPVGGIYWLLVTLLPRYVEFRYPAKLLVVASLAIGQLAAIGWDRAALGPPRRLIAVLRGLAISSAAGAAVACALSFSLSLGDGVADRVFGPFDSAGAWRDILRSLAHTAVVAALAAWLVARLSASNRANARRAQIGLLALTAAELVAAHAWLVPTAPASLLDQPPAAAASLPAEESPVRVYRGPLDWPAHFRAQGSPERIAEIVAWQRNTLAPRHPLAAGVGLVNSYDGLKAADYERLLAEQTERGDPWIVVHGACQYELTGTSRELVPVSSALPRVQFVRRLEDAELSPSAALTSQPTLQIVENSPQRVIVRATLAEPGWIVLRDRHAPGWRARVTGSDTSNAARQVPIARADHLFRAVALPAGDHTVEFTYWPNRFLAGAAISSIAWLIVIAAALRLLLRARRNHA